MPQVEIVSLEPSGNGVGRLEGKVVFVPLTVPGDLAEIQIAEDRGSYLNGRLVKLTSASKSRTNPPCSVFGSCGGCQWQHIDYPSQLEFKKTVLQECLSRIGKIEGIDLGNPIPSPSIWNYRYTARLHSNPNGEIGFFKMQTHKIIEFDKCHVIHQHINKTITSIRPLLQNSALTIKSLKIAFNEGLNKAAILIELEDPKQTTFLKKLCKQLTDNDLISAVNIQGIEQWPVATINYIAGNINFHANIESFTQANVEQNKTLVAKVVELVRSTRPDIVVDLFCGIGNLSLPVAKHVEKVYGVDFHKKSIIDAKGNAKINGIENCSFVKATAIREIKRIRKVGPLPDLVIMDPPRRGAKLECEELARLFPKNIIYVSCNPTTLARDLSILVKASYHICSIRPIDMFPHNFYIESITHLKKD